MANALITPNSPTSHAEDFTLSSTFLQITNSGNSSIVWYSINATSKALTFQYSFGYKSYFPGSQFLAQSIITASGTYYLCYSVSGSDVLYQVIGITVYTYNIVAISSSLFISPDQTLLVFCQPNSVVYIYSASTKSLLHTLTPAVPVTTGTTGKITFDSTSSYMIKPSSGGKLLQLYDCLQLHCARLH